MSAFQPVNFVFSSTSSTRMFESYECTSRNIQAQLQVETAEKWEEVATLARVSDPLELVSCSHANVGNDDDPWPALRQNYVFLFSQLQYEPLFLACLYENYMISNDDFEMLSNDSLSHEEKVRLLIVDVLPSNPPQKFATFCLILRCVNQSHIADLLEQNPQEVWLLPQAMNTRAEEQSMQRRIEMLLVQVSDLDRDKQDAMKKVAAAEVKAQEAREEATKANTRAVTAEILREKAEVERRGDQLIIMALRMKCQDEINDNPPTWTEWNVHIPSVSWSYGSMGEIQSRLVLAGGNGNMHVLTDTGDNWDTFSRKHGDIQNVVCHQDVCLVCLYDREKDRVVIEQFYLNEDDKWRFVTVLPEELQLYYVSVALCDNSLYVLGGRTWLGERVNTACVCDLHTRRWSKMDGMQTKRCDCFSAIIDNTLFVGGGWTDVVHSCNTVECADVRTGRWRTIPSTTNYGCTLTAVSNKLVVTGGLTQQTSVSFPSHVVELYDERSKKWLPLPSMVHKRWLHAAISTQNGELITAGGRTGKFIESLNCH
ncbi:uncharacterized protein LOC134191361 isoform X2 [Corticium candelabrum]|nr:uncharacterized protein LOC134191361 isoform X2 [Corticium candelabrum]